MTKVKVWLGLGTNLGTSSIFWKIESDKKINIIFVENVCIKLDTVGLYSHLCIHL